VASELQQTVRRVNAQDGPLEQIAQSTRALTRMADSLGESVGATVGFRVRGETRIGARTRIEVVTEGVLTRMLHEDGALEGVGLVIFDEFHERSLNADLGLALSIRQRLAGLEEGVHEMAPVEAGERHEAPPRLGCDRAPGRHFKCGDVAAVERLRSRQYAQRGDRTVDFRVHRGGERTGGLERALVREAGLLLEVVREAHESQQREREHAAQREHEQLSTQGLRFGVLQGRHPGKTRRASVRPGASPCCRNPLTATWGRVLSAARGRA